MDVQFITSVAPIVRDVEAASSFYQGALGLSFEGSEGDYVFTQSLAPAEVCPNPQISEVTECLRPLKPSD